MVAQAKLHAGVRLHRHPAQSPDLVPIEGIWLIIKQRLRGHKWKTVAQFRNAIQQEWDRITLQEIRDRINEMP
jgi:hypothetical protein